MVGAGRLLWGHTKRITPGASCGRGPESQPGPQSLALAPRRTCGDTGWGAGRESDGWALRTSGAGAGSHSWGKVLSWTHAFPAGTRRLSSGARLRRCSPIVTTEEPSWERGAGEWRLLGLDTRPRVPESALARRPWELLQALGAQGPGADRPHGQKDAPPSPKGPTCQLPQPHIHVLSWAFAAALSMDDHLGGSDIHLSWASAPPRRWPRTWPPDPRPIAPGTALSSRVEQRPGLREEGRQAPGFPAASVTHGAAHKLSEITHACPSHTRAHRIPLMPITTTADPREGTTARGPVGTHTHLCVHGLVCGDLRITHTRFPRVPTSLLP